MPPKSYNPEGSRLGIAAVIFRYAEEEYKLGDEQTEAVIATVQSTVGLKLGPDVQPILRLAAAIPLTIASLSNNTSSAQWTPTEYHFMFGRELRRISGVTKEELEELDSEMAVIQIESPGKHLSRYAELGYTLMMGRLFGLGEFEPLLDTFSEVTASALSQETEVVGPATRAVLVYNSAYQLYQNILRTTSKAVVPNADRAKTQAANKKAKKSKKRKEAEETKKSRKKGKGPRKDMPRLDEVELDEEDAGEEDKEDTVMSDDSDMRNEGEESVTRRVQPARSGKGKKRMLEDTEGEEMEE